jgi:hypothetical protein
LTVHCTEAGERKGWNLDTGFWYPNIEPKHPGWLLSRMHDYTHTFCVSSVMTSLRVLFAVYANCGSHSIGVAEKKKAVDYFFENSRNIMILPKNFVS